MSSRIRQHDQIGRELPVPVSPFNKCGRSYRAIKALILYWEGDSLNYEPYGPMLEAIALQTAFNGWGWPAEIYEIPFNDPVARTRKFLKKQTGNTGSDELLLVYYVGHGNRSSQGQPFSIYRDRPVDVDDIVEWPVIRSVLEAAKCDVVMFLYCCHGADAWVSRNLVRDKYIGPCGKIMCIIAAAQVDQLALMSEKHSLGILLKEVIDSARSGQGTISISALVQEMKKKVEQSDHFKVLEVVRGGYDYGNAIREIVDGIPMVMVPMGPYAYYSSEDVEILLRTLGSRGVFRIKIGQVQYQRLSGWAGAYWERQVL